MQNLDRLSAGDKLSLSRLGFCYCRPMNSKLWRLIAVSVSLSFGCVAEETNRFDAAPFAVASETNTLFWEDPRSADAAATKHLALRVLETRKVRKADIPEILGNPSPDAKVQG